jgi:hypothetical protein
MTVIFQLPDNNASNNRVAWKQAISVSFLKDILLPFRQTNALSNSSADYLHVSNTIKERKSYCFQTLTSSVLAAHLVYTEMQGTGQRS